MLARFAAVNHGNIIEILHPELSSFGDVYESKRLLYLRSCRHF
jgi:hypothetical protein